MDGSLDETGLNANGLTPEEQEGFDSLFGTNPGTAEAPKPGMFTRAWAGLGAIPAGVGSGLGDVMQVAGEGLHFATGIASAPAQLMSAAEREQATQETPEQAAKLLRDSETWQPLPDFGPGVQHYGMQFGQDERDFYRPDPATTGAAGQFLFGAVEPLARIATGEVLTRGRAPLEFAAGSMGLERTQDLMAHGVDTKTAIESGAIHAGTFEAMGAFGGEGSTLAKRMLKSAAINTGAGLVNRGLDSAVLNAAGYQKLAEQEQWNDAQAAISDMVIGAAFPLIHAGGAKLADAFATRSETKLANKITQNPELFDHLRRPDGGVSQFGIDAALTSLNAAHARSTAPGVPADARSQNLHLKALDVAIQQTVRGDPVDIEPIVRGMNTIPRPVPDGKTDGIVEALNEGVSGLDVLAANPLGRFPGLEPVVPEAENFGFHEKHVLPEDHPLLQSHAEDESPERTALRQTLIDERFAGKRAVPEDEQPIAVVMGGGGGSGKGSVQEGLRDRGIITDNMVHLDPDDFKTGDKETGVSGLPEYAQITETGDTGAANATHAESDRLYHEALTKGIAGHYNLLLDRTLSNPEKAKAELQALRDAGYKIVHVGVTIPVHEALARASERHLTKPNSRFVPPSALIKAHVNYSNGFEQFAFMPDETLLFDNFVPRNGEPKLIFHQRGGGVLAKDENLYNEFRRKGRANKQATRFQDLYPSDASGSASALEPVGRALQPDAGALAGNTGEAGPPTGTAAASTEDLNPAAGGVSVAGPVMQNRNRARAASLLQMADIANAPDPQRLGFSRDPNTGAPMVSASEPASAVPEADQGREDVVIFADGRKIPVRYAVVDAGDVQASHSADGTANPDYADAKLQALNNGRVAGLQAAWTAGHGDAYKAGMVEDAGMLGIDPKAIEAKARPVVIRLYDAADNFGDMGKASNDQASLGLSPAEQAITDARALPDLAGLPLTESGAISMQADNFHRAFLKNLGVHDAATMLDANGHLNKTYMDRLLSALFAKAYGNDRLTALQSEVTNPDARNVLNALTAAAPAWAKVDHAGPLGDYAERLAVGMDLLQQAAAKGGKLADGVAQILAQGDLVARDTRGDAWARFFADNIRSGKRITEALRDAAQRIAEYQNGLKSGTLFKTEPLAADDITRAVINIAETRYGHEPTQQPGTLFNAAGRPARNAGTGSAGDGQGHRSGEQAGRAGTAAGDAGAVDGPDTQAGRGTGGQGSEAAGAQRADHAGNGEAGGGDGLDKAAARQVDRARQIVQAAPDTVLGDGLTAAEALHAADAEVAAVKEEAQRVSEEIDNDPDAFADSLGGPINEDAATYRGGNEAGHQPGTGVENRVEASSRDLFTRTRGDVEREQQIATANNEDTGSQGSLELSLPDPAQVAKQAADAVEQLVRRYRGSVLADAFARNLQRSEAAQLTGKTITSHADLAVLAHVYRNPSFETLHYIFVDAQGKVLGESAVSSRMPASSAAFPRGRDSEWLSEQLTKFGADGFWMLHNHPSGVPMPSVADTRVTQNAQVYFGDRFKGHVVIDHDTYGVVGTTPSERSIERIPGASGQDPLRNPHGRAKNIIGFQITGPSDVAESGIVLAEHGANNSVSLIVTDSRGRVSLATSFPDFAWLDSRTLYEHGVLGGASRQFAVIPESLYKGNETLVSQMQARGALSDAIVLRPDGSWLSAGGAKAQTFDDAFRRTTPALQVHADTAAYDASDNRAPALAGRQDIADRIRASSRRLAREDPAEWAGLTKHEQLRRAWDDAQHQLVQEAVLKRHRVALDVLATNRTTAYIQAQITKGLDTDRLSALSRMLEGRADGKNNITSVWSAQMGIYSAASTYLTKAWHAAGGRFLHLMSDPRAEALLIRALYGDTSVPEQFRRAAEDFSTIADRLRRRFNASGGDIGKLDNWGIPQSWSAMKLLKAGKEAWTDAMLPLLDRGKYVHDDGRAYTDAELRDFLGEAWQTVATHGANKVLGGPRIGGGLKANRMSAERQIHLKDAESQTQARQLFSDRGVLDSMLGHVRSMSRNIALVEQFGPNADRLFKQALDDSMAREVNGNPHKAWYYTRQAHFLERVYNYMAGNDHMLPSTWYGRAIQGWRNLNLLKLSATVINSLGDWGTMLNTAHVNGVPKTRMWLNELRLLNPLDRSQRRIAESAGLMVREYSQMISRFGADIGAHGWTSKLGNTVLKLTLAPYVWRARQQSFSLGMMNVVGDAVANHAHIADLAESDRRLIAQSGINDTDWQVMRLAQPDDWGGNHSLITPESIYRIPDAEIAKLTSADPAIAKDRAASALMGLVYAEQDRAVLEPGARVKVMLGADQDPDSVMGILGRSFSLFKTYSFDLTMQHLTRALKYYDHWTSSVGYLAALIATTTVLGATANAINDIIMGRDPRSLNPTAKDGWKNWAAALVRGGGLGVYGDYLINTAGARGNSLAETLMGPLVSDASSVINLIQKSIAASTDPDADTLRKLHSPALEAERTVRSYIPGANIWYNRAVLDHLIFNNLADYLDPGYLQRMKTRARRQNRTYWWEPDQDKPKRAPDLTHVTADH